MTGPDRLRNRAVAAPRAGPPVRRRRRGPVVAAGALAVVAYVAGAWLSAALSPAARRPILDSSFIPQPYHWVSPPPSLAKGNRRPDSGDFTVAFQKGRIEAGVFSTNDQQATVVFSLGAIPPKGQARSVHLTVRPLDPATVAPAPKGYSVLGNVYRIEATYEPGGDPVTAVAKHPLVVLLYPATITHGLQRNLAYSADEKTWSRLKTTDDPTAFQASSTVSRLNGLYAVITRGGGSPVPSGSAPGTASPVPWVVIGIAAAVGAALVFASWRARVHRREYESYRGPAARGATTTTTARKSPPKPGTRRTSPRSKRRRR
jgi:hypothetical protein